MPSLYAISNELQLSLDAAFDPDTGEALPIFEEHRAIWGSKANAVTAYLLNIEADAEKAEQAIERIKSQILAPAKAKARRLRAYLAENMAMSGIREIKANDGSFVAKLYPDRDESVDVFDEQQLPQDYLRVIPEKFEPDKALIKKAIKDGFEVPGAKLLSRDRLTIR